MFGGGGVNLGDAFGRIIIDESGVTQGVQRARQAFSQGMQDIGGSISQIGTSLTMLTAPLTVFGVTGLNAAADFQAAMTQISARTGIVGEDLERISQFAMQMGADTVFSGQQAADAFLQLLTSGQNAEEAMQTLPLVLNAAAASGEDLGRTADTLTDIMAAYGLQIDRLSPSMREVVDQLGITNDELTAFFRGGDPGDETPIAQNIRDLADAVGMTVDELYAFLQTGEDASTVVESLARAAGASSADMASLGQGFANVGPIARNFGMSVDQTAATLAVLAENGVKGAEAGTALKSMLLNMGRDTEDVLGAWETLGTSLYDAEGNMRDVQTVLWELDRALDVLPVEEQNRLMQDLAGSYGIVALSALRGELSIQDMTNAMDTAAGAGEVASAMMNTWGTRVDSLMGSIETLQIEALTPLIETALTPFIEQLTETINGITEWARENPELTSQIVMIAGALAVLGPVLIIVGQAVGALGVLIAAITSPIGLVIAAIAALALAWTTDFLGIRTFVETEIFPRLQQFFGWLGEVWQTTIRPGLQQMYEWFVSTGLPWIRNAVDFAGQRISEFINTLGNIWAFVSSGVNQFKNEMERIFGWVQRNVIDPIAASIDSVKQALRNLVVSFGGGTFSAQVPSSAGVPVYVQPSPIIGGSRDSGGPGLANMAYLIGAGAQPEVFIPETNGQFIPNFDQVMQQLLGGTGGNTYNIMMPAEALASPGVAQERGREFAEAFHEEMRRRG